MGVKIEFASVASGLEHSLTCEAWCVDTTFYALT